MTTTRRCHGSWRSRDAVRSAATVDFDAATKLLEDHNRWMRMAEALPGLLEIEFTSSFIDTELMCPDQAHLVVHLDALRQREGTSRNRRRRRRTAPDLSQRVTRALEAVVSLCATAKLLSPWSDLYEKFWERVVECDATGPPLEPSTIEKWVRYTKARGIPLLLSWCNKPFDPEQLIEPLRAFLSIPQPQGSPSASPRVTIGFRFVYAAISTSVLERLYELLLQPLEVPDLLLIDPTFLRTLWFNSNPFYADELNVLASLLSDLKARRVDELKLENFIVYDSPGVAEPAFATTLSRVFTALFAKKPISELSHTPVVSLSLAHNCLSVEHLDALRHAFDQGTRPVSRLSLSSIDIGFNFGAWMSLARIIFLPQPLVTSHATLDLSCVNSKDDYSTCLTFLVRITLESRWPSASLECSFTSGKAPLSRNPDGSDVILGSAVQPHTFYSVEDFDPSTNHVKITVPGLTSINDVEPVTGWVSISSITELFADRSCVIGSSFTRLIYEGTAHRWPRYDRETVIQLISTMGSRLTSLSLDHHRSGWYLSPIRRSIPAIFSCPRLQQLSMEHSSLSCEEIFSSEVEGSMVTTFPSKLQVLNVGHSELSQIGFDRLEATSSLRYLSLLGNSVGTKGIASLLPLLSKNKNLQLIELNPQISDPPALCEGLRTQIDTLLGREYLNARDKAAVLSVLTHTERYNPQLRFPGIDVVSLVFAFVGTKPMRKELTHRLPRIAESVAGLAARFDEALLLQLN